MASQSPPAAATDDKAGAKSGWLGLFSETAKEWSRDNAMRLSAALSLYTVLSLAPLLVIAFKIIGMVWRNKETARETFMHQLTMLMGSQTAGAIQEMLQNGSKPGKGIVASVVSTALLLFSASGVFGELQAAMNIIWKVQPKPNQGIIGFLRNRFLSMGMVLGIAFLLLVSMFLSTFLATLAKYLAGETAWLAFVLDVTVTAVTATLLFGAIFKVLPDVKLGWRQVLPGAAITGLLFIVGKYALTLYFKFGTPTSAFGAAGSLAAIMLWVYYSAFILFFGAEFTKVWSIRHGYRVAPDEHAEPMDPSTAAIATAGAEAPSHNAPAPARPAVVVMMPPPKSLPARIAQGVASAGAIVGAVALGTWLEKRKWPLRYVSLDELSERLHDLPRR